MSTDYKKKFISYTTNENVVLQMDNLTSTSDEIIRDTLKLKQAMEDEMFKQSIECIMGDTSLQTNQMKSSEDSSFTVQTLQESLIKCAFPNTDVHVTPYEFDAPCIAIDKLHPDMKSQYELECMLAKSEGKPKPNPRVLVFPSEESRDEAVAYVLTNRKDTKNEK